MKSSFAPVEKIIVDVAATEIMPRFRKLVAGDIEMKGLNDPVTVADKAAEDALTAQLTSFLPGSVVVGEESFAKNPGILSRFGSGNDVWVIDPIDGTRNFIDGKPEFAVMIALVRGGQTIASWIHDPNSGDTLMAEQGAGVWLREHKMRLAGQDASVPTIGLGGSKLRKFLARPDMAATMKDFPPVVHGSAAAFDYARMFAGEELFAKSTAARASFLVTYRRAMPWDHMAGLLMIKEGGGYSGDWAGQPYDAAAPHKGLISAASQAGWERLHEILQGILISPEAP